MGFSAKQREVIDFGRPGNKGYGSLSVGSVRSAKSHGACHAFGIYALMNGGPEGKHLLTGKSWNVVREELVPHIFRVADSYNVPHSINNQSRVLRMGDQRIFCITADNEGSWGKISGLTCHSALFDELTLFPESFFDMARSRLTFPDSKWWATCNPAGPRHWLKLKHIDKGLISQVLQFTFEDNPILSEEVKERYRSMYFGVFAKRMIDGQWAASEGCVYTDYFVDDLDLSSQRGCILGVDYGISSPSAVVPICSLGDDVHYVPAVYGIEGGTTMQNPTDEDVADLVCRVADTYRASKVLLDPSAVSLRNCLLRRKHHFALARGVNDILPGIRVTLTAMATKKLIVSSAADELLNEFQMYQWDELRDDTPIDAYNHYCDALRYAAMDVYGRVFLEGKQPRNPTLKRGRNRRGTVLV